MRQIDSKVPASYNEAARRIGRADESNTIVRPISSNTRLVQNRPGSDIELQYHGTPVVTYHPSGSMTLLTGGWHTVTTKARMNAAVRGLGARVYQHKHEWRVRLSEHSDHVFFEGFRISAFAGAAS